MKKFYKIIVLLIVFIFLTTYNPNKFTITPKEGNFFFKVRNIDVVNNFLINESEITEKLSQINGKNIFFINKNDIEKPLESVDFLERIEVKKKYPNSIIIKIYETKPVAILFKKNKKFLLDSSSNIIAFNENIPIDGLPNVFGKGAEQDFLNFFELLEKNNFPKKIVKNLYYFKMGRWDLQLSDDKIIKFPKDKTAHAIQQSVKLLDSKNFKNYNIIDLRIYGKLIVE